MAQCLRRLSKVPKIPQNLGSIRQPRKQSKFKIELSTQGPQNHVEPIYDFRFANPSRTTHQSHCPPLDTARASAPPRGCKRVSGQKSGKPAISRDPRIALDHGNVMAAPEASHRSAADHHRGSTLQPLCRLLPFPPFFNSSWSTTPTYPMSKSRSFFGNSSSPLPGLLSPRFHVGCPRLQLR